MYIFYISFSFLPFSLTARVFSAQESPQRERLATTVAVAEQSQQAPQCQAAKSSGEQQQQKR